MYHSTRMQGFGAEQKRRILMGTYALSAGYIDAYYTRAQQVSKLGLVMARLSSRPWVLGMPLCGLMRLRPVSQVC